MHRNPFVIVAVIASICVYAVIRQVGHLMLLAILRLPVNVVLQYRFLPTFEARPYSGWLSWKAESLLIASGPVFVLAVGYLILFVLAKRARRAPSPVRLFVSFLCYITLIIDPIYYTFIPLFGLDGEPERLAFLAGVPMQAIQIAAIALLAVNVVLARKRVIPLLQGQ